MNPASFVRNSFACVVLNIHIIIGNIRIVVVVIIIIATMRFLS
jgi:hypothetical protein